MSGCAEGMDTHLVSGGFLWSCTACSSMPAVNSAYKEVTSILNSVNHTLCKRSRNCAGHSINRIICKLITYGCSRFCTYICNRCSDCSLFKRSSFFYSINKCVSHIKNVNSIRNPLYRESTLYKPRSKRHNYIHSLIAGLHRFTGYE